MDHSYFRDRVSAFHDRELPPQELAVVEDHVRGCAECQELLAKLERLDALVAQHAELSGGDYWEKSARKIEERLGFAEQTEITPVKRAGWDKGLVWKVTAIAATLAVLAFIGINRDKIMPPEKVVPSVTPPSEVPPTAKPTPTQDSLGAAGPVESKVQKQITQTRSSKGTPESTKSTGTLRREELGKQETTPPAGAASGSREAADTAEQPSPQPEEHVQPLAVEPRVTKTRLQGETANQAETEQPQTASTDKAVRTAPSQVNRAYDQSRPSPSVSQAAPEVDSTAVAGELNRWRVTRDSLANLMKADDVSLLNKYSVTSLVQRADRASRGSLKTAFAPSQSDKTVLEKAYLQATYEIALRTTDSREYQSARSALQKVASDRRSANAEEARTYLSRLSAERQTPPEN